MSRHRTSRRAHRAHQAGAGRGDGGTSTPYLPSLTRHHPAGAECGLKSSMRTRDRKHTKNTTKRVGRPRKHSIGLPVFESLGACAAATHIPLTTIKLAKRSGSDAFQRQRVDLARLLRWLFDPTRDKSGIDYSAEFKKWQSKREKLRYDREAGRMIDKSEARSGAQTAMSAVFSEIDRLFLTELPPALKGRDEGAILAELKRKVSELRKELRRKFDAIGAKKITEKQ